MTFPAATIPSNLRLSSKSDRSASIQGMNGALFRATASIAGSKSIPTTSSPRRANSIATRPVPQPASKTRCRPSDATRLASP